MTLSHTGSALSNTPDISEIADTAAEAIRREVLERFVSADVACDFARVEMLVFDSVAATGREMLRTLIEARDDAAPRLMRDDKPWYRAGRHSQDHHDTARGGELRAQPLSAAAAKPCHGCRWTRASG